MQQQEHGGERHEEEYMQSLAGNPVVPEGRVDPLLCSVTASLHCIQMNTSLYIKSKAIFFPVRMFVLTNKGKNREISF